MTDTPRMILGADGNGAYGAFATLPGHDVTTTDPAELGSWAFRSDWPSIENLHQVGRVSGLNGAPGTGFSFTFPTLAYIPFMAVRYEASAGVMQDDPWVKVNTGGTDPYKSPYRLTVWTAGFNLRAPVGESENAPMIPAPPRSAVYFVWRIPLYTP